MMYAQAQQAAGAGRRRRRRHQAGGDEGKRDEKVVDAEFTEVKEQEVIFPSIFRRRATHRRELADGEFLRDGISGRVEAGAQCGNETPV